MRTLAGKRVVVTGGGSGIGQALSLMFAGAGAEILVADLNGDAARETVRAVVGTGGRARAYIVDVGDPGAVASLRTRILDDGGPVDVLINNAGIVHGGAFLDVPLDAHLATSRVNIDGVVIMTHAFLPDLLSRPEAHLVIMASASGLVGLPFGSTYGASKWAVIGLGESLRMELAELGHRHVGVTTVCPSYVRTGMFDGVRAPRLTRLLTPDRVAGLTLAAVRRNRARVLTPWLVAVTPLLRAVLPRPAFDLLSRSFGVTTGMASWRGRQPAGPSALDRR